MLAWENQLSSDEKRFLARLGIGHGVNNKVIKKLAIVKKDFDEGKYKE